MCSGSLSLSPKEQNLKICHSNLAAAERESRLGHFWLFTPIPSSINSPLGLRHLYVHLPNFEEINMMPYCSERSWLSTNHRNSNLGTLPNYNWRVWMKQLMRVDCGMQGWFHVMSVTAFNLPVFLEAVNPRRSLSIRSRLHRQNSPGIAAQQVLIRAVWHPHDKCKLWRHPSSEIFTHDNVSMGVGKIYQGKQRESCMKCSYLNIARRLYMLI